MVPPRSGLLLGKILVMNPAMDEAPFRLLWDCCGCDDASLRGEKVSAIFGWPDLSEEAIVENKRRTDCDRPQHQ